ncbi:LysR family transcriptional regulator [Clostridium sp. KNHs205]|jgi:DNA-binding transcriptional LysR family regulator|uniref:LysR family transcriptional regulator n=1 Tax=Clostridium sp. KNHs205 TaxID=1449050 RepID=UPI00051B3E12|nr:LysR family transcriptional regulator [Clostridium sp. KNHs205]
MELQQLYTFLIISKRKSFSLAAAELGYAQSTVTMQIKSLENELQVLLFDRLGRSIGLTAAGEELVPYAEQMIYLSKEIKKNISDTKSPYGTLEIGAAETLCFNRIPEILKVYKLKYPEVNVSVKFGNCNTFPKLLHSHQIDLAYSFGRKTDDPYSIVVDRQREELCLLVSPSHELAGKTITPEKLAPYPLLFTEKGCAYRAEFERILNLHGLEPKIELETDSKPVLKQFAAAGLGITLLPKIAALDELENGSLTEIIWDGEEFEIYSELLYHKDKKVTKAMKAFFELVRIHTQEPEETMLSKTT